MSYTHAPTGIMCPICGCDTRSHMLGRPDLALRRCRLCDVVFLPLQSGASEYAHQMETEFFSGTFTARQNRWQELFDQWKARQTLRGLRRFVHSGRLLEVGVGTGVFLNAARRAGFDCMGIDASGHIADHVRRAYGLPVFQGYLEDFSIDTEKRRFDVIVMNHVLEHMPSPKAMLSRVGALLERGGILYIAVPNITGWEASLTGWTSYEPYHLYYFSPATLGILFKDAGLQVLQVKTVEPFSGWFNALARTVMGVRYRNTRESLDCGLRNWRLSLAFNAFNLGRVGVGAITLPLRYIQARLNRGEELVAVVTKA
jgi:2-polyprenyl-3-methyl-5-hydroxy-6-metoxy-1,4-benzoquinol methylase